MKKKIFLGFIALAAVLFLTSCADLNYEAYVTIVNIGNMPMTAWVDGDEATISAFNSQTWAISLESKDEVVQLHLEAEPAGGGDYDNVVILLHGDRDVQTWLAGWDLLQNAGPLKKQSSVIHGSAPR
jgi:hypothetical protein